MEATEKSVSPLTVTMSRRMWDAYRELSHHTGYTEKLLLSSKERVASDVRHGIRFCAWSSYGCSYGQIARAESLLKENDTSEYAIPYSINTFLRVVEQSNPDRANMIREVWDETA